jgi:hypothetical protein
MVDYPSTMVTVLCSRCHMSETTMWPCVLRGGEPCLVCKEDIELERKIQELQDMRRRLRTRMNASHDPFTFKFPPEIASLIFSLSMEENDDTPLRYTLHKLPMSFLLGSVSRRWRQLARSMPQLWSTVSFTLVKQRTRKKLVLPPLKFINDWLQLSGSLPLTLCIVDHTAGDFDREICRPIVDAFNQHSGRWRKASLHVDKYLLSYFRGTSSPTNLHDLEIGLQDDDETPPTHFSMNSRPSPTRLTIQAFHITAFDVAWGNVTCLTLGWMLPHECIKAIKLVPLLESCTLSELDLHRDGHYETFHSQQVFKHMRLRKLFIKKTEVDTLIVFNQAMVLPSLEELSYEAEGDFAAQSLISLLNRSGSDRLKALTLATDTDMEENAAGLIELLDAVPSLQKLECRFPKTLFGRTTNKFLQELSSSPPMPDGPGFLPKLQSLTLRLDSPRTSTWGYIPRIFSWAHRKLLSLEVDTTGEIAMDDDYLDQISQRIHEGFNIRIPGLPSQSSGIQRGNMRMDTVTGP